MVGDIQRGCAAPAAPVRQVEARDIQPAKLLMRPLGQLKDKFVVLTHDIDDPKRIIAQGVTGMGRDWRADRPVG